MSTGVVIALFALVGLGIGSFLTAALHRMARGQSLWKDTDGSMARSRCVHCTSVLTAVDLVPVVSYLLLRGKCRQCEERIDWSYPLVELLTAVLAGLAAYRFGWTVEAVIVTGYLWVLWFLFVYDWKTMFLPDAITLPAIGVVLLLDLFWWRTPVVDLLVAVAIGGGFFLFQYLLSKGRWVGGGDIRLGVLMGLMLGTAKLLAGLFFAYIVGALVAVWLLSRGKAKRNTALAFGPFLAGSTMVMLLWGDALVGWYLALLT